MEQAGERGVAKQILGSGVAHCRAESLGISRAPFSILGGLIVCLGKPRAQRLGGDIERIAGLFQKEEPFLLPREGRCRRGCIVDRLIVGTTPMMRSWFKPSEPRPSDDCALASELANNHTKAAGTAISARRVKGREARRR